MFYTIILRYDSSLATVFQIWYPNKLQQNSFIVTDDEAKIFYLEASTTTYISMVQLNGADGTLYRYIHYNVGQIANDYWNAVLAPSGADVYIGAQAQGSNDGNLLFRHLSLWTNNKIIT